ncbi:MAG: ImmA/IrrE family metallo-endopeptidase [Ktedonobacteraceae bacterium]|nr:ImmA/IrrE family metallo-endopeptidase [Ktedonobacteraceae bacterium]
MSDDDTFLTTVRTHIENLYRTCEITAPSIQRAITPLGELIGSFNLVCMELPELTQYRAMDFLAQQGGVVDLSETLDREPLAGYLYANTHHGCIFVERDDFLVRRRFSIAHELGHYFLHFQPLLLAAEQNQHYLSMSESLHPDKGLSDESSASISIIGTPQGQPNLPPSAQMEREANQFAAELLMPVEVVQGLLARAFVYRSEADVVTRLATTMLVSEESMRIRLKNLGLWPLPEKR